MPSMLHPLLAAASGGSRAPRGSKVCQLLFPAASVGPQQQMAWRLEASSECSATGHTTTMQQDGIAIAVSAPERGLDNSTLRRPLTCTAPCESRRMATPPHSLAAQDRCITLDRPKESDVANAQQLVQAALAMQSASCRDLANAVSAISLTSHIFRSLIVRYRLSLVPLMGNSYNLHKACPDQNTRFLHCQKLYFENKFVPLPPLDANGVQPPRVILENNVRSKNPADIAMTLDALDPQSMNFACRDLWEDYKECVEGVMKEKQQEYLRRKESKKAAAAQQPTPQNASPENAKQ